MKTYSKYLVIVAIAAILISCKDKENKEQTVAQTPQEQPVQQDATPNKAKHVPTDEVCMVNDKHMGKKQLEVPFDGKMYYGCCNMCVERIPNDETVRKATDPLTGQKIDKASAYIVSLNEEGNVAYFESEENFQQFLKENELAKN